MDPGGGAGPYVSIVLIDGVIFSPLGIALAYCGGMALLVFATQLVISPIWLHRFRFGPLEYLWRRLTYRRIQPMKKS